jgi:membrane-associated phospholipid phosphatase
MVALAACIATIATLKIAFLACGPVWHSTIVTPSAHAAIAFTVYGSVAVAAERTQRRWLAPVLAILVLGIAISRVLLGAHTQAEVAIGLTVGSAATLLFAWRNARLGHERKLPLLPLLAAGAVIAITLQTVYLPLEELANDIALRTRARWFDCRLP